MTANTASAPVIASTIPVADLGNLLDFLPASDPAKALAWVRGGKGIIGLGELTRITSAGFERFIEAGAEFEQVRAQATIHDEVQRPGSGLVAFGSFAFAGQSPSGGVLIIPEVILGKDEHGSWLTTISFEHTSPPAVDSLKAAVAPLLDAAPAQIQGGSLDKSQWLTQVELVMERIHNQEAGKVVLARDSRVRFDSPTDGRRVLQHLSDEYSSCWTFAVDGLFGATPELLARRHRGLISSRVLAGTISRTGDDQEDTARAAALAADSKELLEHEYAVASLVEALRPYAASFSVPDAPFILRLPNVLHLATDVSASPTVSASAVTSLELAAIFHPTAAVCGTPTQVAAQILAEHEHMDRHRYAGPVGWIGADGDGEWGIALRCGQALGPTEWQIFAGCGIMGDSRPEAEWAEAEAKFAPMRSALGV